MKSAQLVRHQAGTLGRLGAAPAALPTQAGSGSGWIAVVVTTPPASSITWQQTGGTNPSMMLVDQPPVGTLQEISAGPGDTDRSWPYITQNSSYTFYLLPMDALGNTYAPVESLTVQGAPGIYLSPSVPASVKASLQAVNPGLQVYGGAAAGAPPAAALPWYEGDVSVFGTAIPVLGVIALGAGAIWLASSGKR